jgi:hypothetical protein
MRTFPKRTFNDIQNITDTDEVLSLNEQEFLEWQTHLERLAYNNPYLMFICPSHRINDEFNEARRCDVQGKENKISDTLH